MHGNSKSNNRKMWELVNIIKGSIKLSAWTDRQTKETRRETKFQRLDVDICMPIYITA